MSISQALADLNELTEALAMASTPAERAAAALDPGHAPAERELGSTVLCVDDEINILAALKRVLRGDGHVVLTATTGAEALEILERLPVDLVISDMRMPGMDGAQLLEQIHLRWPLVVRILLTGFADMDSTVAAINLGRIFRYVHKPWDEQDLLASVREGLGRLALQREKYRLEVLVQGQNEALKELNARLEERVQARTHDLAQAHDQLQRHYLKSIKVFSNLLELRGAQFAGHGRRVAETARDMARKMGLSEEQVLQIFVASLLHDIGMIGMSENMLNKAAERYNFEEMSIYRKHTLQAEQSLMALEDMLPLMPVIRSHHECFDGSGFPDKLIGELIPLGARILALADAFDDLQNGHATYSRQNAADARKTLSMGRGTRFDPVVLDAFMKLTEPQRPTTPPTTSIALKPGMVLLADLNSSQGMLMLAAGHALSASLIDRLRDFEQRQGAPLEFFIAPPAG